MKIVLFGATGGTGALVLGQALERGHEVVAVVRDPARLTQVHPLLTVRQGDVLDAAGWNTALEGAHAVVSAIGIGTSKEPTLVYSQGAREILRVMDDAGVRRLEVVSASQAAPRNRWREHGWFLSRVLFPLLYRQFSATYDDMRRMEEVLAGSDVNWTAYHPPYLSDRPARRPARVSVGTPLPHAWTVSRAALASVMLDGIDDPAQFTSTVAVAS